MEQKTIVITFGRFQPPNLGHRALIDQVVREASAMGANHRIFTGQTVDAKKNPLTIETKIKWLERIFPRAIINKNTTIKTIFDVLYSLSQEGFKYVILIVGEDRVQHFKTNITPYLTHSDPTKKLELDNLEIKASVHGERVHSSELRDYAAKNEFEQFYKYIPKTISEKDAFELFNDVRIGMRLPKIVYP